MNQELNITTANVSIQIVTVGNNKMTKAVFDQIEKDACFDDKLNFIGHYIFGYILWKQSRFLIWIDKYDRLRKTNISQIYTGYKDDSKAAEWRSRLFNQQLFMAI